MCGRSSSQWLHEPVHTFQNLQEENIQLHVAGSAEGQQPYFSRKLASIQLALRVSPDKQMVTVCTQGECYQAVIIPQAAICPPNRSQGERKKLYHSHPITHPIKSYIRFSFLSVLKGVHAIILCNVNPFFSLPALCIYFCFPFLLDLNAFFLLHLTVVQMTCCPFWPLWLCGASVLSWCLNVLLWKSSFMKGGT